MMVRVSSKTTGSVTRVATKWDKRQMQTDALIASGTAMFVQQTSCAELRKDANAKVEL
jgi:hypothetical protein